MSKTLWPSITHRFFSHSHTCSRQDATANTNIIAIEGEINQDRVIKGKGNQLIAAKDG
jgi:hypothetical protein